MPLLTSILTNVLVFLDAAIAVYLGVFFSVNFYFLAVSALRVLREVRRQDLRPPSHDEHNPYLPFLSLLVPAYNEEVTCVESIRSLLKLRYPHFEIIVCNDGSKDRTVERLREAFRFERSDVNYRNELATAPVAGLYQAMCELPPSVKRLVMIDKENGGKADALNAAINASHGTFVCSMDADSLLEPTALLRVMQPVVDDPNRVIAVGTQVGLSNDSLVQDGQVKELRLPRTWIARFQVVEYMGSFIQSRTAMGQLNMLLILSGVFALFRRDLLVSAGGFLTRRLTGRVAREYCGTGAHTVCEDMEIIVRLLRYALDRKQEARAILDPHPAAWTEAPEVYGDLGKQRGRWYRGLLEVLWYHRGILFDPKYRQVGLFALPYQLFFEALAPPVEALGYVVLPLTMALGLVQPRWALLMLFMTLALNTTIALSALAASTYSQNVSDTRALTLFSYPRARDALLLMAAAVMKNFGYRQYLLFWQLKALRDFLKGRSEWDKFARKGYQSSGG